MPKKSCTQSIKNITINIHNMPKFQNDQIGWCSIWKKFKYIEHNYFQFVKYEIMAVSIEKSRKLKKKYFKLKRVLFSFPEAIVKIVGLRYHYFTVPWNVFDFLLVLASILGILMEDIMIDFPVSPTLLRVVRVFRIGRILRLIKVCFIYRFCFNDYYLLLFSGC